MLPFGMGTIKSEWLGKCVYSNSQITQESRIKSVAGSDDTFVLGMEYHPVITVGKRAQASSELISSEEELNLLKIHIESVERGGEATMHTPGQLVIYPIVNLKNLDIGVKEYLNLLMSVTGKILKDNGINTALVTKSPGLYTDKGKICFFGVRVNKGVTSHGLSINIKNDLNLFKHIRSCGKDDEKFDSFACRDNNASCHEVFEAWNKEFKSRYEELLIESEASH